MPKSLRHLECAGVCRILNMLTEQDAGFAEVPQQKFEGNYPIELR
jgi:hypothetical protein